MIDPLTIRPDKPSRRALKEIFTRANKSQWTQRPGYSRDLNLTSVKDPFAAQAKSPVI
jgi:hypothetical protein